MGVLLIGHVHQLQQLVDDPVALLLGVLQQGGHHTDVLGHRHVGEQADLLDHIADVPAQLHLVLGGDVLAVEIDLSRRGLDEPVDHFQSGGLAAAGGSDEDGHLALLDLEGQVVQDFLAAVRQGYMFKAKQWGTSLSRAGGFCGGRRGEPARAPIESVQIQYSKMLQFSQINKR